eukprot:COSAG01_NODE_23652_length_806_cov_118.776521_2_plen_24_part_01
MQAPIPSKKDSLAQSRLSRAQLEL